VGREYVRYTGAARSKFSSETSQRDGTLPGMQEQLDLSTDYYLTYMAFLFSSLIFVCLLFIYYMAER
jgi:hypothetical protein